MSGHVTEQSHGSVTDDVKLGLQADLRLIWPKHCFSLCYDRLLKHIL